MSIGRNPLFEFEEAKEDEAVKPEFVLVKKEMDPEIHSAIAKATALSVESFEEDQVATIFIGEAKAIFEKAEARRVKMKAPALETCREIDAFFKEITGPITDAIDIVKGKKKKWFLAEDAKRQKLEAEVRAKAAEEERIKRQKLEAQAKKAEEKGNEAKAEALREAAANTFIAPEIPQAVAPKTSYANGFSSTYAADIRLELHGQEEAAKKEIARAVADGIFPHYLIKIDMAEAKRHFKKNKTALGPIHGFMIYPDANVKSGKGR